METVVAHRVGCGELVRLVGEMTREMDGLRDKVQEGGYPTKDGISYLEAKHMLLRYCQHLVFLVLMKAEGKALPGHPVLERLAEDKKLNYQIQKLVKQAGAPESAPTAVADKDDLKYKPNSDMLVSKIDEDAQEHGGVYKSPKFAPTTMEGEESAKNRRHSLRLEKKTQERAARSTFIRDLQNELEGRPEETARNSDGKLRSSRTVRGERKKCSREYHCPGRNVSS